MPCSCFCLSSFTWYKGPTDTNHNETDSSVSPVTKEKNSPKENPNLTTGCCLEGKTKVSSIVLPFKIELQMAGQKKTKKQQKKKT